MVEEAPRDGWAGDTVSPLVEPEVTPILSG
jgi:hypothetical protein